MASLFGLEGCGKTRAEDLNYLIPDDAAFAVTTGNLSESIQGMLQAFRKIPGGEPGWEEALSSFGGAPSWTEAASRMGIHPESQCHYFSTGTSSFLVFQLSDPDSFRNWFGAFFLRLGWLTGAVENQEWLSAHHPGESPVLCHLASHLVLCSSGEVDDVKRELLALAGRSPKSRSFWEGGESQDGLKWQVGGKNSAGYRLWIDHLLAGTGDRLGDARFLVGMFGATLKESERGEGQARIDASGLRIRHGHPAELNREPEAAQSSSWARVLPRDTFATVFGQFDPAAVRSGLVPLLGFLPEGVLGKIHPLLRSVDLNRQLLSKIAGNAWLAWIGLEPQFRIQAVQSRTFGAQLPLFSFAMGFTVEDPAAFRAEWQSYEPAKGYERVAVPLGENAPWVLRLVPKQYDGLHVAVAMQGAEVLLVFGQHARGMVEEVFRGERTPLSVRPESPGLKEALNCPDPHLGVYVVPGGIGGELRERGLPTLLVSQINALYEIWGSLQFPASGTRVEMEVRL